MDKPRRDPDPPLATGAWGWRYHHVGIPTTEPIKNEKFLPQYRFGVGGFESSPYGIEWMRFDTDSPVNELIKLIPHVAFEVDDLEIELNRHDFNILSDIDSPSDGVRVVMIEHNGAPIELIQFKKT